MIEDIKKIVANVCSVTVADIESKSRKTPFVEARHMCMFFGHQKTKETHESIAYNVARRGHCSSLHAIKTVNNLRDTDFNFRKKFNEANLKIEQYLFNKSGFVNGAGI